MEDQDISYIPVISRPVSGRIRVSDLNMVRRDARRIGYYIEAQEEPFWVYDKIDHVSQYLDDRFYRCTQGCYVNFDNVRSMRDQKVLFTDGCELYVGRNNFVRMRQCFNRYLRERAAHGKRIEAEDTE